MSLAFPQWRAVTVALVLAFSLLMLSGAASRAQADCGQGSFVPRQVIVKLNPILGATVGQINATYGSTTLETFPGSTDIYLLQLPTGSGVTETVKQLVSDPRLLYAEPNFFAHPPEGGARHRAWGVSDVAPTSEEYAAQALGLVSAHAISQGEGTTVAVVDTGAQLDHPALKANFKDAGRYDFVEGDQNPSDLPVGMDADCDGEKDEMVGHGTHVAGIVDIAAPAAKIMPLRVLDHGRLRRRLHDSRGGSLRRSEPCGCPQPLPRLAEPIDVAPGGDQRCHGKRRPGRRCSGQLEQFSSRVPRCWKWCRGLCRRACGRDLGKHE